jgi:hypothetical protein
MTDKPEESNEQQLPDFDAVLGDTSIDLPKDNLGIAEQWVTIDIGEPKTSAREMLTQGLNSDVIEAMRREAQADEDARKAAGIDEPEERALWPGLGLGRPQAIARGPSSMVLTRLLRKLAKQQR